MRSPRLPVDGPASPGRRGGARGTGAASGSPPVQSRTWPDELITEPLLLDSHQVARLLGIGRTKAFQLMSQRRLPVVHIGRCVRVSRAGLASWIDNHVELDGDAYAADRL